jgi:hypothetical protein
MVADGHLTDVPLDIVYSGVVSLHGLRILVFLGELNGLNTWATNIGNAYLEAETKERVYIIASAEFGELEGHTLVIFKALSTGFVLPDYAGMSALLIVFVTWVTKKLSQGRRIQISKYTNDLLPTKRCLSTADNRVDGRCFACNQLWEDTTHMLTVPVMLDALLAKQHL